MVCSCGWETGCKPGASAVTATFLLCFIDKGAAAEYLGSKRCTLTGRGTQIHGVAPLLPPVPATAQISQEGHVTLEE